MKASVEDSRLDLWISFEEVSDSRSFTTLNVAASKNAPKVWIDTYGKRGDDSLVSVFGHLESEDARIIALALLKAADVAEGKETS